MISECNFDFNIQKLYEKAYADYQSEDYSSALRLFYKAWLRLKKPYRKQPQAATILSGIGDTYYRMGKFNLAIKALRSALDCEETDQRGLILLRLGQSLYNVGEDLPAKVYLQRAFRLSETQFANENPRYRNAIADMV